MTVSGHAGSFPGTTSCSPTAATSRNRGTGLWAMRWYSNGASLAVALGWTASCGCRGIRIDDLESSAPAASARGPLSADRVTAAERLRGRKTQRARGFRAREPLGSKRRAGCIRGYLIARDPIAGSRADRFARPQQRGLAQPAQRVLRDRVGHLRGLRDLPLVSPGEGRLGRRERK